jgi:hypothetical protein
LPLNTGNHPPAEGIKESFLSMLTSTSSEVNNSQVDSSDSSDDEDINSSIQDYSNQDINEEIVSENNVIIHDREWIFVDGIQVDVASHTPRKASFHWPKQLHLGNKSIVKYFYLMYPMQTVPFMLEFTNKRLKSNNFGTIDEGKFFRWLGIRLLMTLEPRKGDLKSRFIKWKQTRASGNGSKLEQVEIRFCFDQ